MRHAIVVVLLVAFGLLAYWQAVRAGEGNLRSYAYAVEWPIFGAFVVYVWWKTIKDELHPDQRPKPVLPKPGRKRSGVTSTPDQIDDSNDPELAAYNRYLAELNNEGK